MKYIDAEKLKAEIERLMGLLPEEQGISINLDWARNTLVALRQFITSLQQEQPEVDLEKEIQSFWNANALEYRLGHVADINFLAYTARHFYELGQSNQYQKDREEFAKLKAKEWQSGYDEGYAKGLNARKEE